MTFSFQDWQRGAPFPKDGWDCADAIDDGWTSDQLVGFMRATAKPWVPPALEKSPEKPADAPRAVDGQSASPGRAPPIQDASEYGRSPIAVDHRIGQIVGIDRFDIELEAWLSDHQWKVRLNLLSGEMELHRPTGVTAMTDERVAEIRFRVTYASNGKEAAKDKIVDALSLIAERHAFHPVLDYLDCLTWDGKHRLDEWTVKYLGADDTPLSRAVGRKMLCAAVRRVKQPGCKFDAMLVLEGPQEIGKSSLVRALCHDPRWFTDQLEVGADPKVTIEKTAGAWIVEMPELDGMGKRDTNRVKSFITTTDDRARLSYARFATTRPRQFVLFGTTNETNYLSDLTGNRRFWIVRATRADPAGVTAVRDQLWAEAVQAEPGENLWLDDPMLKEAAASLTRSASDFGPWLELLEGRIPDGPLKIEAADAWKLVGIDDAESINRLTKAHHAALRAAMSGLGFVRKDGGLRNNAGQNVRAYVRGASHQAHWWRPGDLPPNNTPPAW